MPDQSEADARTGAVNVTTRHTYPAAAITPARATCSPGLASIRAEWDRLAALVQMNQATPVQRRRFAQLSKELGRTLEVRS